MNFYSIVQTCEDDEFLLSVLPTKWTIRDGWAGERNSVEGRDVCFWPKNIAGSRLLEKMKKDPDVDIDRNHLQVYRCKIKRTGFQTYNEATRELNIMEMAIDAPKTSAKCKDVAELFKAIQGQGATRAIGQIPSRVLQTVPIQPEPENLQLNLIISLLQGLNEKCDTIQTVCDNLKKDLDQTRSLVSRVNAKVDLMASNNTVPKASSSSQKVELKQFSLSPVQSLDELNALEENCKDEEFVKAAIRSIGRNYGKNLQTGNGATVCLKVVDCLFTREFLTKCSWTGMSRTRSEDGNLVTKIGLHRYERAIDLFYQIVAYSDPEFPVEESNNFLRRCLQNAKQRFEEVKGVRNTSSRKRRKKIRDVEVLQDAASSSDGDVTQDESNDLNVSNGGASGCEIVKEEPIILDDEIISELKVFCCADDSY